MSTWTSPNKSTVEKSILTEDDFIILCEDGNYLLQEDDNLDWGTPTKNTATYTSPTKTATTWTSPTKN